MILNLFAGRERGKEEEELEGNSRGRKLHPKAASSSGPESQRVPSSAPTAQAPGSSTGQGLRQLPPPLTLAP